MTAPEPRPARTGRSRVRLWAVITAVVLVVAFLAGWEAADQRCTSDSDCAVGPLLAFGYALTALLVMPWVALCVEAWLPDRWR